MPGWWEPEAGRKERGGQERKRVKREKERRERIRFDVKKKGERENEGEEWGWV